MEAIPETVLAEQYIRAGLKMKTMNLNNDNRLGTTKMPLNQVTAKVMEAFAGAAVLQSHTFISVLLNITDCLCDYSNAP